MSQNVERCGGEFGREAEAGYSCSPRMAWSLSRPLRRRSEEERLLRVLPVVCPRRDLWRNPILMVRIAGAGFWDWFSSLDGAYLYDG